MLGTKEGAKTQDVALMLPLLRFGLGILQERSARALFVWSLLEPT